MSDTITVLAPNGKRYTYHPSTARGGFVYVNGRRVYGTTSGDGLTSSLTFNPHGKYAHLVAARAVTVSV